MVQGHASYCLSDCPELAAHLTLCLQLLAKTGALLDLHRVLKEIRARCSQRAEPTPGWWSGHQPGRAIATLRGIMEGVISRTVSFSSPVGEVREELFFLFLEAHSQTHSLGGTFAKMMFYELHSRRATRYSLCSWKVGNLLISIKNYFLFPITAPFLFNVSTEIELSCF